MPHPFRLLWGAGASANLGDGIAVTALPLIALAAGSSPSQVALVTTMATLAWPVVGLHAGWIVDRTPPALLLLVVNGARGLALALLAGAICTELAVFPFVIAAAIVYGVGETVADTAITASVPQLVPSGRLTGANSRLESTTNLLNAFVGPPLAGFLVGVSSIVAAVAGSGLYLVTAAVALPLVRLLGKKADRRPGTAQTDRGRVRDGIAYLWQNPVLRALTLLTAAMNLIWSAWTAVFVVYAITPGPLGLSPAGYGWLLAMMAVGGIAAAVLTPVLARRVPIHILLFVDLIGTVLLVLPVATGSGLPMVAFGMVVAGTGASVWRILVAVIRQQNTPAALLGRVYAASRVISWGALPLGSAAAALIADIAGVGTVFTLASVLAVGLALTFPPLPHSWASRMKKGDHA